MFMQNVRDDMRIVMLRVISAYFGKLLKLWKYVCVGEEVEVSREKLREDQPTMFMKKVRDMRIVMQSVSFSPESGGVWNPKIT